MGAYDPQNSEMLMVVHLKRFVISTRNDEKQFSIKLQAQKVNYKRGLEYKSRSMLDRARENGQKVQTMGSWKIYQSPLARGRRKPDQERKVRLHSRLGLHQKYRLDRINMIWAWVSGLWQSKGLTTKLCIPILFWNFFVLGMEPHSPLNPAVRTLHLTAVLR